MIQNQRNIIYDFFNNICIEINVEEMADNLTKIILDNIATNDFQNKLFSYIEDFDINYYSREDDIFFKNLKRIIVEASILSNKYEEKVDIYYIKLCK